MTFIGVSRSNTIKGARHEEQDGTEIETGRVMGSLPVVGHLRSLSACNGLFDFIQMCESRFSMLCGNVGMPRFAMFNGFV
jgi:hypothetical protein